MNKRAEELITSANERALALGHSLKPFTPMIIDDAFHSTCERCGAYTAVATNMYGDWKCDERPHDKISNQCKGGG
jgi:hypothetical protein